MALIRNKPIVRQYYKVGRVALAAGAPVGQVVDLLNKGVIKHDTTTRKGTRLFLPENVQKIIDVFIMRRTGIYTLKGLAEYYKTGNKTITLND